MNKLMETIKLAKKTDDRNFSQVILPDTLKRISGPDMRVEDIKDKIVTVSEERLYPKYAPFDFSATGELIDFIVAKDSNSVCLEVQMLANPTRYDLNEYKVLHKSFYRTLTEDNAMLLSRTAKQISIAIDHNAEYNSYTCTLSTLNTVTIRRMAEQGFLKDLSGVKFLQALYLCIASYYNSYGNYPYYVLYYFYKNMDYLKCIKEYLKILSVSELILVLKDLIEVILKDIPKYTYGNGYASGIHLSKTFDTIEASGKYKILERLPEMLYYEETKTGAKARKCYEVYNDLAASYVQKGYSEEEIFRPSVGLKQADKYLVLRRLGVYDLNTSEHEIADTINNYSKLIEIVGDKIAPTLISKDPGGEKGYVKKIVQLKKQGKGIFMLIDKDFTMDDFDAYLKEEKEEKLRKVNRG